MVPAETGAHGSVFPVQRPETKKISGFTYLFRRKTMALFGSKKIHSLKDLYVNELRDLYSAESQILEALPKMEEAATHKELKKALKDHVKTTKKQRDRLERVFKMLNEKPDGNSCEGIKGIIKEGVEIVSLDTTDDLRDAALLSTAQRVEHYEMAGYGSARNWAMRLNRQEESDLLQETLNEEGQT